MSSAEPRLTLSTPAHASSLAFSHGGRLVVGGDDGSVRFYNPPKLKVTNAIRSLGGSISSIVFAATQDHSDAVWIACGRSIFFFSIDALKLISNRDNAVECLELGQDDDDVLNEIALNANCTHLAFSCDSGVVGVVDLSNNRKITRMKIQHQSICGTVSFIPDRPSELISGGYDCALLHFDFNQGTLLSRYDFTAPASSESGISLSPPFILSTTLDPSGLVAAGTADGRVLLGAGGAKSFPDLDAVATTPKKSKDANKKKRSRKWGGLDPEQASISKVAEGPIVALAFAAPYRLISCTLLGSLTAHSVIPWPHLSGAAEATNSDSPSVGLKIAWTAQTKSCAKVNTVACHREGEWIAVGGLDKDGKKGVVELWKLEDKPEDRINETEGR